LNPDFNISSEFKNLLIHFIENALNEDVGIGDITTLSTIDSRQQGTARLLIKDNGILAGNMIAKHVFQHYDNNLHTEFFKNDGDVVHNGETAFVVKGSVASILITERLVLNLMQRLSGIATKTHFLSELIKPYGTKILDTRKTTPNMRFLEKWAVKVGGGYNHRFGLYDMVLIKDNHVDAAGGITNAVERVKQYFSNHSLSLPVEVEVRNFKEIDEVLSCSGVDRILLDNFSIPDLRKAVERINKKVETEASGNINEQNIVEYAKTGVDYISSGSLTHTVKPLDLSLKIVK